jgi:methylglyoxal synthase
LPQRSRDPSADGQSANLSTYQPNEVIVPKGGEVDRLSMLRDGMAIMSDGAGRHLTLERGDVLGELSWIGADPSPFEVRACNEVVTLEIAHAQLEALKHSAPQLSIKLLAELSALAIRRMHLGARSPLKYIAVVAHDGLKDTMLDFVHEHTEFFSRRALAATRTTAKLIEAHTSLKVLCVVESGPRGGDQQIAALIAAQRVRALFFFKNPMLALPHDVDVAALCRICDVHDVMLATNRETSRALINHLCQPRFQHDLIHGGNP